MSSSTATRRAARAAAGLLVAAVTAASLGACSQDRLDAAAAGAGTSVSGAGSDTGSDTIDLVSADVDTAGLTAVDGSTDASTARPGAGDRKGLRARMLRALHGTWVTKGPNDTWVTHQAIRGDVTAVSATSVTVKAADGVSLTFAVTPDTKVRQRSAGKGVDSTIGAVRVGAKALVAGVGANGPTARVVVFRLAAAPSATGSAS